MDSETSRLIKTVEAMVTFAEWYLESVPKPEKSVNVLSGKLTRSFDEIEMAIYDAFEAFNLPEIGLPEPFSRVEYEAISTSLPWWCAQLISRKGPSLIEELSSVDDQSIHVARASQIATEFRKLSVARLGMAFSSVERRQRKKQARNAGRKKKGTKGALKHALERITVEVQDPTLGTVLEALRDHERMADLCEALNDPLKLKPMIVVTDGKDDGIDVEANKVYYEVDGKQESRSISTIERHLRSLKQS